MINTEEIIKLSKYEDQILELIADHEELTQSDLQGRIQAIVLNIYRENK